MKIDYAEMKATVAAAMKQGLISPPQEPKRSTDTYFRRGLSFKKQIKVATERAVAKLSYVDFMDSDGTSYRVHPNGMWEKLP